MIVHAFKISALLATKPLKRGEKSVGELQSILLKKVTTDERVDNGLKGSSYPCYYYYILNN